MPTAAQLFSSCRGDRRSNRALRRKPDIRSLLTFRIAALARRR
jgi:hypothetical protein